MPETPHRPFTLTTGIAAASMWARNRLTPTWVPDLIHAIQQSLADLERSRPGDRAPVACPLHQRASASNVVAISGRLIASVSASSGNRSRLP